MTSHISVLWCEDTQQYGVGFHFHSTDGEGNSTNINSTAWLTPLQLEELKQAIAQSEARQKRQAELEWKDS